MASLRAQAGIPTTPLPEEEEDLQVIHLDDMAPDEG